MRGAKGRTGQRARAGGDTTSALTQRLRMSDARTHGRKEQGIQVVGKLGRVKFVVVTKVYGNPLIVNVD